MRRPLRNGYRVTNFEIADSVRDALKKAATAGEIVTAAEKAAERLQVLCRTDFVPADAGEPGM